MPKKWTLIMECYVIPEIDIVCMIRNLHWEKKRQVKIAHMKPSCLQNTKKHTFNSIPQGRVSTGFRKHLSFRVSFCPFVFSDSSKMYCSVVRGEKRRIIIKIGLKTPE